VIREIDSHVARNRLKKLIREDCEPEAIASQVERDLTGHPREDVLDELADCLLVVRDSCKQGSVSAQFPAVRLLAGFQQVAQKKGIRPEEFYRALLEKLLLNGETEEGLRPQVKPATREKILNAALDLFYQKGFHLATVDEIAERAGVGKGTLYRYFASKGALFNELIKSRTEELERNAQAVLDGQDDVLTMITKYVRIYFEFFDHNKRLYRLILQERLDLADQVQELYVKKVMRRIPVLKRKIREASQQGVLKDVDFQTVFYGVMGFIHGVIQKWLVNECSYPLVDELPTVMEVLFYGFVKSDR